MKKVFIKYNPYNLETEILVDEKKPKVNSRLSEEATESLRLQEWVDDLPKILVDEYNDKEFEITFHGTKMDYDDLASVLTEARENNIAYSKLNRIPAKETEDKIELIDEVFNELTREDCPFDEFKNNDALKSAFMNAKKSDFEISVVATMSAGKSTLINAMLGAKLMPSKQNACTATITRIKDVPEEKFRADVYNKEGSRLASYENLTYEEMDRSNKDEKVSEINVFGSIPFLAHSRNNEKRETNLILIDTPGPDNARNEEHKIMQEEMLNKNSKALILYIMTPEFETNDENETLKTIADSMKVNGKASRDRFIFVVNKLNERKEEDDPTDTILESVREYLNSQGIEKPNLFPVAALPALNMRLLDNPEYSMNKFTVNKTNLEIEMINSDNELHFEKRASLPPILSNELKEELSSTRENWKGAENENPEEAIIHTGITALEAAIRQYVTKYAKTAKIKNIADIINGSLDSEKAFEELIITYQKELEKNKNKAREIEKNIVNVKKKLNDAQNAKTFESKVNEAQNNIIIQSKDKIHGITTKFQTQIRKKIEKYRGDKLSVDEAHRVTNELRKFAESLEPKFKEGLISVIKENVEDVSKALIKTYKAKIKSLNELDSKNITNFTLDPFELISGRINIDFDLSRFTESERIQVGEHWEWNKDVKWYNPFSWFQPWGWHEPDYETHTWVDADRLNQEFFTDIEANLRENQKTAENYVSEQSKKIGEVFMEQFNNIDKLLNKKLDELKNLGDDKEDAVKRADEAQKKLNWIDGIKSKIDSILEI